LELETLSVLDNGTAN